MFITKKEQEMGGTQNGTCSLIWQEGGGYGCLTLNCLLQIQN